MKNNKVKKGKHDYLDQIDAYYSGQLSSHEVIEMGITPNILQEYGASELPLVMQQSTLTKCVRKATGSRSAHELTRDTIEKLPDQIHNPIFLIRDRNRNSIALISDVKDKNNNNILIAIRLNEKRKTVQVNEIKSVYGKTRLKEYLLKNLEAKQLHIINKNKAENLSRVLGLQLPTTLIDFSCKNSIPLYYEAVKNDCNVKKSCEKESTKWTERSC